MEHPKILISNSWKEIILALIMPIFFLMDTNWLLYSTLLLLSLIILFLYYKGEKKILFTFLVLQTYHSEGLSVYSANFLGISIIYYIIVFLVIIEFYRKIKVPRLILLFLILLPLRTILGFFYKFDTYSWAIETVLFLSFSIFCLITYNYKNQERIEIVNVLKKYVLFYYPYLTLISLYFSQAIDYSGKYIPYYFDEFGAFYLIALFPILFLEVKRTSTRVFLLTFHLLFIYIKISYLYIGSFALIGVFLCLFLMTILYFKKHLKYLILVCVILILSSFILQKSNKFVQFKVAQVTESFNFFIDSPGLHKIKNIPNSPRIRILEFLNIQKELRQAGITNYLFGKGFGSYFTDKNYSFKTYDVKFYDNSAYSPKEMYQKKYIRPHNTFFYMPLKIGFLGVLWIILIIFDSYLRIKYNQWILYAFTIYILIFFDSGLKSFIFVGCMMAILFKNNRRETMIKHSQLNPII